MGPVTHGLATARAHFWFRIDKRKVARKGKPTFVVSRSPGVQTDGSIGMALTLCPDWNPLIKQKPLQPAPWAFQDVPFSGSSTSSTVDWMICQQ